MLTLHKFEELSAPVVQQVKELNRHSFGAEICFLGAEFNRELLLCYEDARLIGFTYIISNEQVVELYCINVHSDYRRRGHARSMLSFITQRYVEQKIWLHVEYKDVLKAKLYTDFGFTFPSCLPCTPLGFHLAQPIISLTWRANVPAARRADDYNLCLHFSFIYYRRAGVIAQNRRGEYLLVQNYGKLWSFPKGSREKKDLTALHCAIREFQEETGINIQFRHLLPRERISVNKQVYYFASIDEEINRRRIASPVEITDIKWVTCEEILKMPITTTVRHIVEEYLMGGSAPQTPRVKD